MSTHKNIKSKIKSRLHSPNQQDSLSSSQPEPQIPSSQGSLWSKLLTWAAMSSATLLLLGGGWLAVLLILDPDGVLWINRYLPKWFHVPLTLYNAPQTFAEIESEVSKYGLKVGQPVPIASELLIPLWWSESNCYSNCDQIVSLRVYRYKYLKNQQEIHYQLLREVEVPKVEKSAVSASGAKIDPYKLDNSSFLPLKRLSVLPEGAKPGVWINLSSDLISHGATFSYGHLWFYEPSQQDLRPLLQWTSPAGEVPQWQQVTGNSEPELVMNQSLAWETHFQVYQFQRQAYQPRLFSPQAPEPFKLVKIDLDRPAPLTEDLPTTYHEAIALSRKRLWSPALAKLRQVRQQVAPQKWTAQVQAQLDVIALQAQATRTQCHQSWHDPSRQILNCLADGSLRDAFVLLQASLNSSKVVQEVNKLIKADTDRFWQRIEGILAVNPQDREGQIWGVLIKTIATNRQSALAWWEKLPEGSPEQRQVIEQLLDQWEQALVPQTSKANQGSQIVGTAELIERVNPKNWLSPSGNLANLDNQKSWYRIQVTAFHDPQGWQKAPFIKWQKSQSISAQQIWRRLKLDSNTQIKITSWTFHGTPQSNQAIIKAARLSNGLLELLAGADVSKDSVGGANLILPRPLAHTKEALRWLQPGSVSLADLYDLQPELVAVIVPELWQELRANAQLQQSTPPNLLSMLAQIGHWQAQPIDLTGNSQPELIITVDADSLRDLNQSSWLNLASDNHRRYKTGTLIFSEAGALLYSEFSHNTFDSFRAIADLSNNGGAALLVSDADNYYLKRWSVAEQRFH